MSGAASPGDAPEAPAADATQVARLGAADAAIYETFVVPRYVRPFADLALSMLVRGHDAQVVHVDCRTGYPDVDLSNILPDSHIFGCDPSRSAIELARAKAATSPGVVADYRTCSLEFPTTFPSGAFSHALALHPLPRPGPEGRYPLMAELARLLAPHGQAIVALPMRGSFPEVADLLREYALKTELTSLNDAVDRSVFARPTLELLSAEVEKAGFEFVDADVRTVTLEWKSGRDFHEDPISRLVLLPEFRAHLGVDDLKQAWEYLRDAIDKYWSDATFEVTVHVGCASGRKI